MFQQAALGGLSKSVSIFVFATLAMGKKRKLNNAQAKENGNPEEVIVPLTRDSDEPMQKKGKWTNLCLTQSKYLMGVLVEQLYGKILIIRPPTVFAVW